MTYRNNIQEIIQGCLAEQSQAQRALVDKYSGFLLTICKRYMKDTEQAKDLLQESLMKIFQNLDKYNEAKGSFESWISTIAIRLCLSKFRKNKIKVLSMESAVTEKQDLLVGSDALNDLNTEILVRFISELPDLYKVVFNLAAIDGYSHKEIAELLNISEIASRSRLNRGKSILKKRILTLQKNESWVNTI